jgi:sugar phosphate permease
MALVGSVAVSPTRIQTWMPYLNVLAYAIYALVGFVAGAVARRHNVLNGAIAGILAVAIAVLAFGAAPGSWLGILVLFFNGAIIGGIGGTFSMVLGQRNPQDRGSR